MYNTSKSGSINGNKRRSINENKRRSINGNQNGSLTGNGNGSINGNRNSITANIKKEDLLKPKEPCISKIKTNKYETMDTEIREWWESQFQKLEGLSQTPLYKKKPILEKCYSLNMLKQLVSGGVEVQAEWGEDLAEQRIPDIVKAPREEDLREKIFIDKYENILHPKPKYTNPYLNFCKKPLRKAQIWRSQPKPMLGGLPLIERVEQLEETLATDFDEWFKNVGSKAKSEIDKDVINLIFEIVMSYPIMTSICTKVFEIGCVPQVTANFVGFPEKSASASIQRQIQQDIAAGTQKPRMVAFNKILPIDLRRKPFTENLKAKWLEYQMHRQDLATMAAVWRGITHLYTTKVFLQWLLNHPEVTPPPFLVSEGAVDRNFINKSYLDLDNISQLELKYGTLQEHDKERGVTIVNV